MALKSSQGSTAFFRVDFELALPRFGGQVLGDCEKEILEREAEVARIEALFAAPDFHRTHGTQTDALMAELAAAKESVAKLYSRWQELEAIRAETEKR